MKTSPDFFGASFSYKDTTHLLSNFHSNPKQISYEKQSVLSSSSKHLVEATGVEPVSENLFTRISTSVVCYIISPQNGKQTRRVAGSP